MDPVGGAAGAVPAAGGQEITVNTTLSITETEGSVIEERKAVEEVSDCSLMCPRSLLFHFLMKCRPSVV